MFRARSLAITDVVSDNGRRVCMMLAAQEQDQDEEVKK